MIKVHNAGYPHGLPTKQKLRSNWKRIKPLCVYQGLGLDTHGACATLVLCVGTLPNTCWPMGEPRWLHGSDCIFPGWLQDFRLSLRTLIALPLPLLRPPVVSGLPFWRECQLWMVLHARHSMPQSNRLGGAVGSKPNNVCVVTGKKEWDFDVRHLGFLFIFLRFPWNTLLSLGLRCHIWLRWKWML